MRLKLMGSPTSITDSIKAADRTSLNLSFEGADMVAIILTGRLSDVEMKPPSLEDVFLDLTETD